MTNFSSETIKARRQWGYIFRVMKEKTLNLYTIPSKNYLSNAKAKIKNFQSKHALPEIFELLRKGGKLYEMEICIYKTE